MLKVISFTICPFVQRVTGWLEAKGLPYEIEYISLKDKPQWFLDLSPNAQVPVLITESGQALFESDAIVEYLEEAYGPLNPNRTPEDKAVDRAWSYLASKNYLVQCSAQRSADEATLNERSVKLEKAFATVEKALGDARFFNTSEVGMVDIAWLPLLHRAAIIEKHRGYDFLAGYPQVKRWQQHLLFTGLAEKSVSDDFEAAFSDFYLSEQTFLGRGCDCPPGTSASDNACASATCC